MTEGGYIMLWRMAQDDELLRSLPGEQFKATIGLLLSVNWSEGDFTCHRCGKTVHVPKGATAKSVRTLANEAFDTPLTTMHRTLQRLCRSRFAVRLQSSRCHAVYLVKNFEKYQSDGTQAERKRNASGTQAEHIEEEKEEEEEKEVVQHAPVATQPPRAVRSKPKSKQLALSETTIPSEAWETAKLLRDLILGINPDATCGGPRYSAKRWATDLDSFQRTGAANPIPWELLEATIRWALAEPYWRTRITTPGALTKSWDTIRAQMTRPAGPPLSRDAQDRIADFLED